MAEEGPIAQRLRADGTWEAVEPTKEGIEAALELIKEREAAGAAPDDSDTFVDAMMILARTSVPARRRR